LKGLDLERVTQANILYDFCEEVCGICLEEGIAFSVENPESAVIWRIPGWVRLRRDAHITAVNFDQCMQGGDRNAHRRWLTNLQGMRQPQLRCDGKHDHLPWDAHKVEGRWNFTTRKEAPYPDLLCCRASDIVFAHAKALEFVEATQGSEKPPDPTRLQRKYVAAAVGVQPRGRTLPLQISELIRFSRSRQHALSFGPD
jgi:hypothetical protein